VRVGGLTIMTVGYLEDLRHALQRSVSV